MAIQSTFNCNCGRKITRMFNARASMEDSYPDGPVYCAPRWDHLPGDAVLNGVTCGTCDTYHEFIEAPKGHPHANVRRS